MTDGACHTLPDRHGCAGYALNYGTHDTEAWGLTTRIFVPAGTHDKRDRALRSVPRREKTCSVQVPTFEEITRGSRHFTWRTSDGETFTGLAWDACDGNPRADVLCLHGLSGAAADFGPLGRRLAGDACDVWAVNLRGQGNDPDHRRRGHCLDPRQWRDDLAAFAGEFLDGNRPLYLVGESMGSLVAVDAVANGALTPRRLVLSVPVTEIRTPLPGWMVTMLRGAAGFFPRMKLSPLRFVHGRTCMPRLTADDGYMHYLKTIPHRVGGFTLEFLANFHEFMQSSREAAARVRIPTLMLAAGRDVFIRPEQSRAFFEMLGCDEKEYLFYPGGYHLLWHDADGEDVVDRIARWLLGA